MMNTFQLKRFQHLHKENFITKKDKAWMQQLHKRYELKEVLRAKLDYCKWLHQARQAHNDVSFQV